MRKKLFIVACSSLFLTSPTFANQCANTIINKTKVSLGSSTIFKNNVCTPYLLTLAKHPVRRKWMKMSPTERTEQINYACKVFYSVAGKLAKLNPSKIKWSKNVGTFEGKKIVVGFAGGCVATTACFADYPCLQNIITDYKKLE